MVKHKVGTRAGDLSICEHCNGIIHVVDEGGELTWWHWNSSLDEEHVVERVRL